MTVKPYILGSVVARGGMAEVYRGLHVGEDGFKRLVAIKRILPHQAQNAEFAEMFKDEAHIGQRLQHANVVKVEGFDIIEGCPSIIMEFVDGSDLRSLLSATENRKQAPGKKSFFPVELCLYIIAEAARGLHYAHLRRDDVSGKPLNIVHRDISPQNLLISWDGEVKITDFGIAAADRDFKQTETKAGIVKGKYSYMSPEQISGKKCDARTDVFALSVVLWEMLAMNRLFIADNEIEVIEMVRNCKIPTRIRDKNPAVTEELEMIVLRGLTKDPRRRYESMDELEKALRSYLKKSHALATASELGSYMKDAMADKRAMAQDEMRKILTADHSSTANSKLSAQGQQRVELNLESSQDNKTSNLTVGRGRAAPNTMLSQQPTPHPISMPASRPASTFRTGALRQHDENRMRSRHSSKSNSMASFFWLAAACVLAIGGGFFFKSYKNAAKQSLTLTLRATPQPIRVKINDRDHAGGRFVSSPAKIRLDPGLNSIEVTRPGYTTEKILINTDDGAPKIPPAIKLKPAALFAPVRIEYRGTESVIVSVNDGFARQQLTTQKNTFQIPDMPNGVPSELVAINSLKKVIARCNFTPANTTERRPLIVIVDGHGQPCEFSGNHKKEGSQ